MGFFGGGRPPRIVVKNYGRWSFLGLLSPLLAVLYVGKLRSEGRLASEDPAVIHDIAEMARRGYRVVAMETYELPAFGIDYRKVTFERAGNPEP